MVSLSAIFSSLYTRRNPLNMVSAPPRKVYGKRETPSACPTIPPSAPQLPPDLNALPLLQSNLQPSPPPHDEPPRPESPGDDFLAEAFSDSDDDSDSDSDDDRRYPKFDYDARFRPLQNLDLSKIREPGPGAELCYTLEDFGPDNMKSWCLPDFVSSDIFATVTAGELVYFITEFNEFFWLVWVHSTSKPGVVTAFNIEGGLEKEARLNKEENEKQSRTKGSRKRALKGATAPNEDNNLPPVFVEDEHNEQPRGHRSVGFKSIVPQKVFRYVAPDYTPVGKESNESLSWVDGWVEVFCPEDESLENSDAWRPGRGLSDRIGRNGFRRFRA